MAGALSRARAVPGVTYAAMAVSMIFRTLSAGALAICASLMLSGCFGGPSTYAASPNVALAENGNLPAPSRADLVASTRPYLIGPFDKLSVNTFGVQSLSGDLQVDASGRLSVPLIGVVEAAGLTPGELAATIEDRLRGQYVRDPQVTVNLEETVSQVITVDGQVKKPGLFPVVGRITLMRAVATAGGTDEFAKLSEVLVFRDVGGQRYLGVYDLGAIRNGNYPDPELYGNDIVVVGDSPARRLFKDVIAGSSLITTPLIILLRS